jgi:hypothetical protein
MRIDSVPSAVRQSPPPAIRAAKQKLGLVPGAMRTLVAHKREGFFREVDVIGGSSSNSSRDGTDPARRILKMFSAGKLERFNERQLCRIRKLSRKL